MQRPIPAGVGECSCQHPVPPHTPCLPQAPCQTHLFPGSGGAPGDGPAAGGGGASLRQGEGLGAHLPPAPRSLHQEDAPRSAQHPRLLRAGEAAGRGWGRARGRANPEPPPTPGLLRSSSPPSSSASRCSSASSCLPSGSTRPCSSSPGCTGSSSPFSGVSPSPLPAVSLVPQCHQLTSVSPGSNDAPGDPDTARLLEALLAEPGFGTKCMKEEGKA